MGQHDLIDPFASSYDVNVTAPTSGVHVSKLAGRSR